MRFSRAANFLLGPPFFLPPWKTKAVTPEVRRVGIETGRVHIVKTCTSHFGNGSELMSKTLLPALSYTPYHRSNIVGSSNTTFPGASLQSRTVGFPESGFDLGPITTLPSHTIPGLNSGTHIHPCILWFAFKLLVQLVVTLLK